MDSSYLGLQEFISLNPNVFEKINNIEIDSNLVELTEILFQNFEEITALINFRKMFYNKIPHKKLSNTFDLDNFNQKIMLLFLLRELSKTTNFLITLKCIKQKFEKKVLKTLLKFSEKESLSINEVISDQSILILILNSNNPNLSNTNDKINLKFKVSDSNSRINKPLLVLDLDETLIHSEYPIDLKKDYDFTIKKYNLGIFIQNSLYDFLDKAKEKFNLILYSSGEKAYVKEVVRRLEIQKYFLFVLSREYCINVNNCIFIKDLSIFDCFSKADYSLNQHKESTNSSLPVYMIDNNIFSVSPSLESLIVINSFENNKKQQFPNELLLILNSLESELERRKFN